MDNIKYLKSLNSDTTYFDIEQFAYDHQVDIHSIPFSIRVLLENSIRKSKFQNTDKTAENILNWKQNVGSAIPFYPARVILQDYTGVPCIVDLASMRDAAKSLGMDPEKINPEIPVDLVVDHSVQVDQAGNPAALAYNIKKEFSRNSERYQLLKWAQKSFKNFRAIPPDTGIIHQINIEYLSPVIQKHKSAHKTLLYPDTVFGTDSHTTMINGLGVLGWGVGGIEAEACMLGEPSTFLIPDVIGVKLINQLPSGVVATDLALKITQVLREHNVVGKFVEYFGPGYEHLPVADRATISNMSPEYGSTCGYFPIDSETLKYLKLTGRKENDINLIEKYAKQSSLFYSAEDKIQYSDVVEIDLSKISTNLAGPKRPQDLVPLSMLDQSFEKTITAPSGNHGFGLTEDAVNQTYNFTLNNSQEQLKTGDILIAAITSCTNTSNPAVLVGAGLLAKKAIEKGLTVSQKVKTSFAPGSQAVTRYLKDADLLQYFNKLGFNIIAYGCTTCIGNSGPLAPEIEDAVTKSNIVTGAILSGNRNFEGRISPLIKANYLASPILVIAYALAGNLKKNLQNEPLGKAKDGTEIYLRDIWPSTDEIEQYVKKFVTSENYRKAYESIFSGKKEWDAIQVKASSTFPWDQKSTYIANPPYFDDQVANTFKKPELQNMRVLAKVGDSVTTDHISPAGLIPIKSPAAKYLIDHGVALTDFNSFGSRRGNHNVMVRGTLANVRLHNELANGKEGGYTNYLPDNSIMDIFEASEKYKDTNTELLVIAGKDYGMGSSRDWAAKGVKLLGVKAVIAESFERIHRSNLVMMGVVPLQFLPGENAKILGLDGTEKFTIQLPDSFQPKQKIAIIAKNYLGIEKTFNTIIRFDSKTEIADYNIGGILNKVLVEKQQGV